MIIKSTAMSWQWLSLSLVLCAITVNATNSSHASVDATPLKDTVDLNKTIQEVEKILDKYPELPRIERSEILSILQNITAEDNEKLKEELTGALEEEKIKMISSKEVTDTVEKGKNRTDGLRSVMVVLPFHAEDTASSLEELYTKSPVVRIEQQTEATVKATTYTPRRGTKRPAITEQPPFSIVEKENAAFNPPLKVIGFRYHTTPGPSPQELDESSRTYENFQDPEQVTMTFRTQEITEIPKWNHREKVKEEFHLPETMDNFSLEDVMTSGPQTEKIVFSQPETTTKDYITTTTKPIRTTMKPRKKHHKSKTTKIVDKTTTTTTVAPISTHNIANVLENLPPNMKELLDNIGIKDGMPVIMQSEEKPFEIHTPKPIRPAEAPIDAASYMKFKPLPLKKQKNVNDDMKDFLASFGLIDNQGQNREQKAVVENTTPFDDTYLENAPVINSEILSDKLKATLDSLGLYDHRPNKPSRTHIFNPRNVSNLQTEEEVKKLNSLLSTIKKLASLNDTEPVTPEFQQEILRQVKELDNITISYKTSAAINQEIHNIMEKNKGKFKIPIVMKESTVNTLPTGINPEYYEAIQLKNEVKRQENSSTSEPSSTTEETSSTSTTEEPQNSPDLEDAFGGGETASAESNPSDSLPPKRPNGLYFLLDWNTFFQVGTEDDKRRVNIRFQPKVGDGRNFLPVTIP